MSVTAKPLVTAKFANASATAEYIVPSSTRTILDKVTAYNSDTGMQTIKIYIVPSGGTAGTSNLIVQENLVAGTTTELSELQNQILGTNESLVFEASNASKIVIRASGRECT